MCVCEPTPGVLEADETLCLYPGLTEHPLSSSPFPLLSSLPRSTPPSSPPPPTTVRYHSHFKGYSCGAAPFILHCCVFTSSSISFFFFLKPFIRLEQTGVDGGRTGEVACCCALSLCQMDAAWRCREDGGFGCYER